MGQLLEAFKGISLPDGVDALVTRADALLAKEPEQATYIEYLETEIKRLRVKSGEPEASANLIFNATTGTHVDRAGVHFCTRCLSENKRSPLKNEAHGWTCMVCRCFFSDPARPRPKPRSDYDPYNSGLA
jgi:hypothetical protein